MSNYLNCVQPQTGVLSYVSDKRLRHGGSGYETSALRLIVKHSNSRTGLEWQARE